MLHPNQFTINEAWIAFRLHKKPIITDDGDICIVGLVDAASGFVLGTMPTTWLKVLSVAGQGQELLNKGWGHKSEWPKTVYVSKSEDWSCLIPELEARGIPVIAAPGFELSLFVREAQESFRTQLGIE